MTFEQICNQAIEEHSDAVRVFISKGDVMLAHYRAVCSVKWARMLEQAKPSSPTLR